MKKITYLGPTPEDIRKKAREFLERLLRGCRYRLRKLARSSEFFTVKLSKKYRLIFSFNCETAYVGDHDSYERHIKSIKK
jgi:mRNA-degrading endonuclease RelE of RelBE toxin-antitoxin system